MDKQAICEKCAAIVPYKTKRPKLCASCRKGTPKVYKRSKGIPTKSKNEALMQRLLNQIFPEAEYIDNGYFSWLPSPKGAPMQADRLYPELKLAFEYNGKQHYEFNTYMHKTKAAFEYLQQCDRLKARLLAKKGYTLISIKYDKKLTKGYLIRRLKEAGVLNQLKSKTRVEDFYEF